MLITDMRMLHRANINELRDIVFQGTLTHFKLEPGDMTQYNFTILRDCINDRIIIYEVEKENFAVWDDLRGVDNLVNGGFQIWTAHFYMEVLGRIFIKFETIPSFRHYYDFENSQINQEEPSDEN